MSKNDLRKLGISASRLATITSTMQDYIEQKKIAGLRILVSRSNRIVLNENLGYSNIEDKVKIQADSIFRIWSMTKPLTVVSIMILFEEGKFLLSDPISKFIPEFSEMSVIKDEYSETPDTIKAHREISIRDLLTCTSGLSYGFSQDSLVDIKYRELGVFNDNESLEKGVEKISQVPLCAQPGESWRYSYSFDVLARLVEVVSNTPFSDFLDERVFQPLDMVDTGYYLTSEKLTRLTELYFPSEGDLEVASDEYAGDFSEKPILTEGGSGLITTINDYYRFSLMLLNNGLLDGVQLLSPKSVSLITANHLNENHLPLVIPPFGVLNGLGFGFGVGVITDASQFGALASTGSFFWGGGSTTLFWVDPSEELIAIVMPNSFCGRFPEFLFKFLTLVYQSIIDNPLEGMEDVQGKDV